MGGWSLAVACLAWMLLGCSGPEIELGGGHLTSEDASVGGGDAGRYDAGRYDAGGDRRSSSGNWDPNLGDGVPRPPQYQPSGPWPVVDDAGSEPACDRDGPYCASGGQRFADECAAWRAGEFDTWPCSSDAP